MCQLTLFDLDLFKNRKKRPSANAELTIPAEIIVAAVELMGAIDLDPIGSSKTIPDVPAKLIFTEEDKGLSRDWGPKRRVFLHPPTTRSAPKWVNKMCDEYESGGISEAIAFLKAAVSSPWWERLAPYPACFIQSRVEQKHRTNLAHAVVYLGHNLNGFGEAFADIGTLYVPFPRKPDPAQPEIGQFGRYVLSVHRTAAYFTIANPTWDARFMSDDQGRLRNAVLKIPGVVPGRFSNVSRSREGSVKLVFSFKKDQADAVISHVEALLAGAQRMEKSAAPGGKRRERS